MKRVAGIFLIAVVAATLTMLVFKQFDKEPEYTLVSNSSDMPVFRTSDRPVSSKGAGINEVDFTIAAEKTIHAVVHVKNVTMSSGPSSIWDYFYGSEVKQRPQVGTGSGVIITPDGYIVTNNHVIAKATELKVTLNDNKSYDAEIIGTDPATDIALIKITTDKSLPYLAFGDSDNTKIGEWVLAVGNPFNLTSTVTAGIVSAKARDLGRRQSFIQTDAAVNPGNSGGALVNTNGDLIGINTAITSQTGSYIGYSFAVPSNIAKKVVEDIMEYGNVQSGILGITTIPVNSAYAAEKGVDDINGVYIDDVEEDSGAYEAGLQTGDVIVGIDDIKVRRFADLTGYISAKRPGDEVLVTVSRSEGLMELPVVLKERQTLEVPVMGLVVKNLNEKDKKLYKTKNGVKITGVPETYRGYGLDGKVIIAVDGEEIKDINDARTKFATISRYGKTSIMLVNEEGERERIIFQ
ncbi:MAG: trypsin-like peptidase domain-containing protein [Flavobacteriaceae bacterium]